MFLQVVAVVIAGAHLVIAQRGRRGRSLLGGQLLLLLHRHQTPENTCTHVVNVMLGESPWEEFSHLRDVSKCRSLTTNWKYCILHVTELRVMLVECQAHADQYLKFKEFYFCEKIKVF